MSKIEIDTLREELTDSSNEFITFGDFVIVPIELWARINEVLLRSIDDNTTTAVEES